MPAKNCPQEVQTLGVETRGPKAGNTNRQTYGHNRAERALAKDEPFSALALAKQEEIESRISVDGLASELSHRAVRVATCADLIFEALCAEWDNLDVKQKIRFTDSYSRMESRAVKALQTSSEMDAERPDRQFPDIIEVTSNGDS